MNKDATRETPLSVAFIMYPVTDVARSAAFYRDVVGLEQRGMNEPWWIEFDLGGVTFGIGNVPDNGIPGQAQSLVVEVADIASYVTRMKEASVDVHEVIKTPYGCQIASFRDPDGNIVWLHQRSA